MAEGTTIRADQIEGLADLIREQVRAVIHESKPITQDVEDIRRSPAGTVIRLEGKVEALDAKIDHLRLEMNHGFEAVNQRFDSLERRFSLFQWVLVLNFSLLIAMAGKFFLMK